MFYNDDNSVTTYLSLFARDPFKKESTLKGKNLLSMGANSFRIEPFYTPPHNSGGVLWFHVGRP